MGLDDNPVYHTSTNDSMPAWVGWTVDKSGSRSGYVEGYVSEDRLYPAYAGNPINQYSLYMKLQRNQTTICTLKLAPLAQLIGNLTIEDGAGEAKAGDDLPTPHSYDYTTKF